MPHDIESVGRFGNRPDDPVLRKAILDKLTAEEREFLDIEY